MPTCLFCKQEVTDGREESGRSDGRPDWMIDGDFGCDESPESSASGCGGHAVTRAEVIQAEEWAFDNLETFEIPVLGVHYVTVQATNEEDAIEWLHANGHRVCKSEDEGARLIAAASDLRRLLEQCREWLRDLGDMGDGLDCAAYVEGTLPTLLAEIDRALEDAGE